MSKYELEEMWEEYCADCWYEGVTPKPFWAWLWDCEKNA